MYIKELGVFMSKSDYEDYKLTEATKHLPRTDRPLAKREILKMQGGPLKDRPLKERPLIR
ncbi:MAG: hypothetical protein BWY46_01994 [Firmicutes bacterium ADurb.Bin300]|nr:MAG: hypothetical protein BWY46_01994 [Firmicutes bacterium ADurb.Bin300]